MKIDPYKSKEHYTKWKDGCNGTINGLNTNNSTILLKFLSDMEIGFNVSKTTKKGARSYVRLLTLRDKLSFIMRKCNEVHHINDITELNEEQVHMIFTAMQNGEIVKTNGKKYKGAGTYIKIFKTFWHWHQKVSKKRGNDIVDITSDLDTSEEKPDWVYLTEQEVKKLCDNARYEYKVLMMFLFDTGIRAPTELMNIKVSDFYNDFKELNIREEISKTFGRRIKLMISSHIVKEYVQLNALKREDYLFKKSPAVTNQYLKRLAKSIFGDKESPAGQRYSDLTMYDFRHCSCCYWLPRYKSESALKYRFGWKKSDKIHYYSELLGMKDTISEEDMLVDVTKTELEQRLTKTENEKEIMQERMRTMEMQMIRIMELVKHVEVLQK